jgi:wyosine [tRNA(Phe)-imidazoG37] synthetase (radical SAM superfamily)
MKFIFGPVASRRFGTSLGIDLSPDFKQCNFDCLYCELAPAATVDNYAKSYPPKQIVDELQTALNEHPNTEVITLTANGEPTLYTELDELITSIDAIKKEKKTLILTNSATLIEPRVHKAFLRLDQVKLSLDAVTPEVFKKIDRPHEGIELNDLVERVTSFAKQYTGQLFIEILIVEGLNDTAEEMQALNAVLRDIPCERIDLGTIDRPPAYPIQGVSYETLFRLSHEFDADLPINIASRKDVRSQPSFYTEEEILNTLDKRPLSPDDIGLLFDEKAQNNLQKLLNEKRVAIKQISRLDFYVPTTHLTRKRSE